MFPSPFVYSDLYPSSKRVEDTPVQLPKQLIDPDMPGMEPVKAVLFTIAVLVGIRWLWEMGGKK